MIKLEKKRILVVEDDPEIRYVITSSLQNAGFEVLEAEHALEAICSMVRQRVDLVLMDIRMPVLDGIALVRELKAHDDTRHVPVVAVTGLDTPEDRSAAFDAGCVGYITKPMDMVHFASQVAAFIR